MIKKYICLFSFIIFLACISHAQDDRGPDTGALKGKAIGTNVEFHNSGLIDRLEDNKIVIDDREFKISSGAQFYSITGEELSKRDFHIGNTAGYRLNMNNEINFLYKIKGE